ncbi:hypothetical protein IFM89_036710 [Coptis chinensis]|uniref:F-box domain-containing protein n=1 Tax=Coptis chinensis TaxID=261450 RepID=A0A835IGQ9_9MAGN|nr:hypothetical protein IFM89_036710 [Coptis chinensis]
MSRRVKRKATRSKVIDEESRLKKRAIEVELDWTSLPDDTVVQLFSYLNYRDRACLSSTCKIWRVLGATNCLWSSLDLRAHKFDAGTAASMADRCVQLQKLRFRGVESANAIMNLGARGLREISGDFCREITDSTLSVMAARHDKLESLQLGPEFCERISSDAIKMVGLCCPKLRKLRLSGVRDVGEDAINALAKNCKQLEEICFMDCLNVDAVALGNVVSVRFLSVAGTRNINWNLASQVWSKLPNLIGLDVSRTEIFPTEVLKLLSSTESLKVMCALNCPSLEAEGDFSRYSIRDKLLLAFFKDTFKGVASLFADNTKNRSVFVDWRDKKIGDKYLNPIMIWLEWILSHSLLRIAESNPQGLGEFWISQGAALLLSLVQSLQEDVQERAATGLATFVVIDDENATVDFERAEVVMSNGGIRLLLDLARSSREGLQSEAAKALANLSVNADVAKSVAEEGGINILSDLARSMNRLVAEEAAGGLWNLSVGEEHKGAIARAGGVKALVNLIFKWSSGSDGVLERAAGALANLAADDKCSTEVAIAGGVQALVLLARFCKSEGVQEQIDSRGSSQYCSRLLSVVRYAVTCDLQEAAGALWNLSFDDRNRETIAAVGGVEALVALAQSCSNASAGLQERAAGALWGLSVSEANSIAIGQGGGVAPLIALASSDAEDVHETAAGALWNLAFNSGNAFRIVEEEGVPALVRLCSSSVSKMARFMAALALAYMFDGRMDKIVETLPSSETKSVSLDNARRMALKQIEAFVLTFSDPQSFYAAAASSTPASLVQVTEAARIPEAGHLRCSAAEIGRFVTMLRNPSSTLKACAAFALLQFTVPGGRHAMFHAILIQKTGAQRVLRAAAAAATAPIEAKIFARIVLRNLEHHFGEIAI